MGLENHPNDDELWRRSPPKRELLDRLYAELLNGSARPELIDELIASDSELAAIVSTDQTAAVSDKLRDEIIDRWKANRLAARETLGGEVNRFTRWSQWSSLAASLLVASAAGLYLGRSVGRADRPELPEATLWANDIESLGLEGIIPGHQGDS